MGASIFADECIFTRCTFSGYESTFTVIRKSLDFTAGVRTIQAFHDIDVWKTRIR